MSTSSIVRPRIIPILPLTRLRASSHCLYSPTFHKRIISPSKLNPPHERTIMSSTPTYELLYHAGLPGRAEHIRLAFEATGTPYTDISRDTPNSKSVYSVVDASQTSSGAGNPPVFALPVLRVKSGAGKELLIGQTPNILSYLGPRLGLVPSGEGAEEGALYVQQLALTALDLNNEVHDTHHPVAVMKYYEEQKDPALLKAADVRENRLPKFFSYFQRTLQYNSASGGEGKYLVGKGLTYADLVVWQVLDGLYFAFPKEMEARKKEFPELLEGFYQGIKKEKAVEAYLESERRLPYGNGIFRYYPELDRQ